PDAELARRDPDLARIRRPDLADDGGVRRIGDVCDQDARMGVRAVLRQVATGIPEAAGTRPIGAVPDIDVVVVDRKSGVHAAAVERVRADQLEVERRAWSSASGSDADIAEGNER